MIRVALLAPIVLALFAALFCVLVLRAVLGLLGVACKATIKYLQSKL